MKPVVVFEHNFQFFFGDHLPGIRQRPVEGFCKSLIFGLHTFPQVESADQGGNRLGLVSECCLTGFQSRNRMDDLLQRFPQVKIPLYAT